MSPSPPVAFDVQALGSPTSATYAFQYRQPPSDRTSPQRSFLLHFPQYKLSLFIAHFSEAQASGFALAYQLDAMHIYDEMRGAQVVSHLFDSCVEWMRLPGREFMYARNERK